MATPTFFTFNVVVTGGTGAKAFWAEPTYPSSGLANGWSAYLLTVCVLAPTGAAAYDWALVDAQAFAVAARAQLTGSATTTETALIYPNGSFVILNATVNGTYTVKIYAVAND